MKELDEEWEKALHGVCRNNSYLTARVYAISRLLNILAALFDPARNFGDEVERILGFASVTTVSNNENAAHTQGNRALLNSLDEYLAAWREAGEERENLLALLLR